jgi:hypothetical protein
MKSITKMRKQTRGNKEKYLAEEKNEWELECNVRGGYAQDMTAMTRGLPVVPHSCALGSGPNCLS